MKNITMAAMAIMIPPMSPTWLAKPAMNAFSVAVFVSAGELANSASMRCASSSDRDGSATRITYQPTWSAIPVSLNVSFK
jgi:hypothetical protein